MSRSTRLVPTRYGEMEVFEGDPGCSKALAEYGEYSESELAIANLYLTSTSVVLDAGAHIGAMTLPFAQRCQHVYACEPQAEVRAVLERNLARNNISNVTIIPFALGHENRGCFYNPTHAGWDGSLGSVSMEDNSSDGSEPAEIRTLDSFLLPQLDFLKADVEGMELHLLFGAQKTLVQHRPVLLLERGDEEVQAKVISAFGSLRYVASRLDLPIYLPTNWKKNPQNYFPGMAHMMCLGEPAKIN